ncbi:MAG: glycosyltransferase family 2 protein [Rhodothermales bacterium]
MTTPPSPPTVSVVIPVYNRHRYLPAAVASVCEQSYPHLQLILYDDGSDQAVLHRYYDGLTDPRIHVIRGPHKGIIAAARNRGAAHATGDYLAFLDSDDLWHPDKLTRQVARLRESGCRWSHARFAMINERAEPIAIPSGGYAPPRQGWILEHLLTTRTWVALNTVVMERSLFDEVGGFDESPELNGRDDYDLFMRIAEREPIHFLDEILGWVRRHPQRASLTLDDGWRRTAVLYERFLARNEIPRLRRIATKRLAYHLIRSARFDCLRKKDPGAAKQKLRRTWKQGWKNPRWWMQWIRAGRLMFTEDHRPPSKSQAPRSPVS